MYDNPSGDRGCYPHFYISCFSVIINRSWLASGWTYSDSYITSSEEQTFRFLANTKLWTKYPLWNPNHRLVPVCPNRTLVLVTCICHKLDLIHHSSCSSSKLFSNKISRTISCPNHIESSIYVLPIRRLLNFLFDKFGNFLDCGLWENPSFLFSCKPIDSS